MPNGTGGSKLGRALRSPATKKARMPARTPADVGAAQARRMGGSRAGLQAFSKRLGAGIERAGGVGALLAPRPAPAPAARMGTRAGLQAFSRRLGRGIEQQGGLANIMAPRAVPTQAARPLAGLPGQRFLRRPGQPMPTPMQRNQQARFMAQQQSGFPRQRLLAAARSGQLGGQGFAPGGFRPMPQQLTPFQQIAMQQQRSGGMGFQTGFQPQQIPRGWMGPFGQSASPMRGGAGFGQQGGGFQGLSPQMLIALGQIAAAGTPFSPAGFGISPLQGTFGPTGISPGGWRGF